MRNQKSYLLLFFLLFYTGVTAQTVIKIPFIQTSVFTVSPSAIYQALPETGNLELGLEAIVSGGSGAYTYLWTLENIELSTESTLTVDKPGNYYLQINDGNGCQAGIMYYVTPYTSLSQTKDFAMIVYPNPSEGIVHLQLKTIEGLENILIYTPDGKTVADFSMEKIKYENNKISLDLIKLPKGEYFISLFFDKETLTKAIILR